MTKAIFTGTFDPFTLGHANIVRQAREVFNSIIVAVALDTGRLSVTDIKTRVDIAEKSLKGISGVEVVPFSGLLTDFAASNNTPFIVRGLRGEADFIQEQQLSAIYKTQNSSIKPVYFITDCTYAHISASVVRELVRLKGNISAYVNASAKDLIIKTYKTYE